MQFRALRQANLKRAESIHSASLDWSIGDWACAVAGECGEMCNEVKKLRRQDGTGDAAKVADEMADTIIYIDLLASRLGIDLWDAIVAKFNRTSEKLGVPEHKLNTEVTDAPTDPAVNPDPAAS